MCRHHFILLWAFIASRYTIAQGSDLLFEDPLEDLGLNSGAADWGVEGSLFDEPYSATAMTPPPTDDNLFNLDSEPFSTLLADNTDICMNEPQISSPQRSRIRARTAVCAPEDSSSSKKTYKTPQELGLLTQESINDYWCPTRIYQGILNIPVCSEYDELQIIPSDLMDPETLIPLTTTGLKEILTCSFSTSLCSLFFYYFSFRLISSELPPTLERDKGEGSEETKTEKIRDDLGIIIMLIN